MALLFPASASVIVALVGCSATDEMAGRDTDAGEIAFWLDLATSEGSSDHQRAVLRRAQQVGTVTYGDVDEVFQDVVACLDGAGLEFSVDQEELAAGSGVSLPAVSVTIPGDATASESDAIADITDRCLIDHYMYVASAYTNQPSSVALTDGAWLSDTMRACLEERGYGVPADVTVGEIQEARLAEMQAHGADLDYPGPCDAQAG